MTLHRFDNCSPNMIHDLIDLTSTLTDLNLAVHIRSGLYFDRFGPYMPRSERSILDLFTHTIRSDRSNLHQHRSDTCTEDLDRFGLYLLILARSISDLDFNTSNLMDMTSTVTDLNPTLQIW